MRGEDVFILINELQKSGYKGINIGTKVSYESNTNKRQVIIIII